MQASFYRSAHPRTRASWWRAARRRSSALRSRELSRLLGTPGVCSSAETSFLLPDARFGPLRPLDGTSARRWHARATVGDHLRSHLRHLHLHRRSFSRRVEPEVHCRPSKLPVATASSEDRVLPWRMPASQVRGKQMEGSRTSPRRKRPEGNPGLIGNA
eukprot:scaffold2858_cov659-Pavlova_lutheri.AAC.86